MRLLLGLSFRHPHEFLDGGQPCGDLTQAVFSQTVHTVFLGCTAELGRCRVGGDPVAQVLVQFHQFVDADSALVAGLAAFLAPGALVSLLEVGVVPLQVPRRRFL